MLTLLVGSTGKAVSQHVIHLPNHDDKRYYIGIAVSYMQSRFHLSHHPVFLQNDSVMSVNPLTSGGIGIGGMHNLRLSPRFIVRAVFPQFFFSNKNLTYNLRYPDPAKDEQPVMTKKVESILVGLPVQLKFESDRIGNFRVYMFAGGKLEYDLASNANAKRAEDQVKLKKTDFGIEAGIGFSFYNPIIIVSPELKISNGLSNSHSRDAGLKYSNVIDRLNSRMVVFSLIFEG